MWPYSPYSILTRIERKLDLLLKQEAKLAIDLTQLTAEIARNTDVETSVVALLGKLSDMIKAIPPSNDPVTQAALDALSTTLTTNDDAIAAAVVANTPAA